MELAHIALFTLLNVFLVDAGVASIPDTTLAPDKHHATRVGVSIKNVMFSTSAARI